MLQGASFGDDHEFNQQRARIGRSPRTHLHIGADSWDPWPTFFVESVIGDQLFFLRFRGVIEPVSGASPGPSSLSSSALASSVFFSSALASSGFFSSLESSGFFSSARFSSALGSSGFFSSA